MIPSAAEAAQPRPLVDARVVRMSAVAVAVAVAASLLAWLLTRLIGLITNLAFYGRVSVDFTSPAHNGLGLFVLVVPVIGGLLVGVLARWGSKAIRGHGIPEAMETVLFQQSKIPARMTILKPLSAAIAIGTGGPFGAEGPIIATGGALGSLVGQLIEVTADERKTLLAAGAAAGMTATFGSPVAAVLLAIELLLFELRPRSVIPVALACVTAAAVRVGLSGAAPAFHLPELAQPSGAAIAAYVLLGAIMGALSVLVSRAVYAVEDAFERLPIHWMWWPAIGGAAVGIIGLVAPRTLGVGYSNIEQIVGAGLTGRALIFLVAMKFLSWSIALGSGTSGGTLAPLFTFGGGIGSALGALAIAIAPSLGVDVRLAALVGMAAMFAGASRALLASVVFAFETTRQPIGLLPLLGGCSAAYLVSALLMRSSIMTERLARRGARVIAEYRPDLLEQLRAGDLATRALLTLPAGETVRAAQAWLREAKHTGFPVLDGEGALVGVVTRADLLAVDAVDAGARTVGDLVRRAPIVIAEDASAREAADRMLAEGVGRVVVVAAGDLRRPVGIVTRSDLLGAHRQRIDEAERAHVHLPILRRMWLAGRRAPGHGAA